MIENTLWMTYFEYLPIELKQAEEEGKNVELYRKEIEEIIQTSGDMSFEEKERIAWEILDRIEKEPIKREFPYQEPNEIEKIEEFRKKGAQIGLGAFGENLIGEGDDFRYLPVFTRFQCGDGILEMTQIGKECHSHCEIYKRMGECIMPREGVFAVVIQGGKIKKGDILEKIEETEAHIDR